MVVNNKPAAKRLPNEEELKILAELSAELRDYEEGDEDEAVLRSVWTFGHSDDSDSSSPPFERTSDRWVSLLGFQQADPISDVRGGGVLALRNLLAFLSLQPHYARTIMKSRRSDGEWSPDAPGFYPFACAGINVTRLVAELAGLGPAEKYRTMELSYWPLLCGSSTSFEDTYAICFRLVDRAFDARNASYMDFNAVLKEAEVTARRALESCPSGASHDELTRALKMAPSAWGDHRPTMAAALDKLPLSGSIYKAGGKLVQMKKRRYFVLRDDLCAWFRPTSTFFHDNVDFDLNENNEVWTKAEVHGELSSCLQFTGTTVVKMSQTDPCSFKISGCHSLRGHRDKVRLCAPNEDEAKRWAHAIMDAVIRVNAGTYSANKRGSHALKMEALLLLPGMEGRSRSSTENPEGNTVSFEADADHLRMAAEALVLVGDAPTAATEASPRRPRSYTETTDDLEEGDDEDDDEEEDGHFEPTPPTELPPAIAPTSPPKSPAALAPRSLSPPPPPSRQSYTEVIPRSPPAQRVSTSAKVFAAAKQLISPRRSKCPKEVLAPASWIACSDEASGRVYFVDQTTNIVQWDLPPGWTTPSSGWSARVDPSTGHVYYFFPVTGETTWTLPERTWTPPER